MKAFFNVKHLKEWDIFTYSIYSKWSDPIQGEKSKLGMLLCAKNLPLEHFLSNSCHLKTDKDFSMKPTPEAYMSLFKVC